MNQQRGNQNNREDSTQGRGESEQNQGQGNFAGSRSESDESLRGDDQ